ncbi:MAG: HIT family protein, partial [Eubacterium sp.]|nr:HIT family protein [Eubacterium sp.]
PTNTLYEDDDVRVILDAAPAAKGHALVIPKEHFADAFEISDEAVSAVSRVALKVAAKLKDELKCDGINILQNNGEAAGQTVFHYHVHVIPRYDADKEDVHVTWKQLSYADGEDKEYVEKLRLK